MQRWKHSFCMVQPVSCAAEPRLPLIGLASPPAHKRSHSKAHLVSALLCFHICILALFYISRNGLLQPFASHVMSSPWAPGSRALQLEEEQGHLSTGHRSL